MYCVSFSIILLICVLIEFDFTGPVIFAQERIGRDNKPFTIYKFRTMIKETPPHTFKPTSDDVRITKIGRLLRDTGLDEVPQLFNVLKGKCHWLGLARDAIHCGDLHRTRKAKIKSYARNYRPMAVKRYD